MHDQLPPGFSISPYREDPPPARPATARSGLAWFRIGARLVAAGLAVGAAWGNVLVETSWFPAEDGSPRSGVYLQYRFSGWGHSVLKASDSLDVGGSPPSGPNFGVLLCIAAAGLLLAAATDWLPGRLRWQPDGRLLAALTAAFLLAVVLSEVLIVLPYRRGPNIEARIGPSPWLAAAGCLLAVLSCLPAFGHSRQSTGQYSGSA